MIDSTPRIYLTDLHAYNCGSLHGKWVDATDEDEMLTEWAAILASSPEPGGEEFFITDYDNFGGVKIDEYMPLAQVARIAQAIEDHGEAAVAWLGYDIDNLERIESIDDYFVGEYDEEDDYRKQLFEELYLDGFKYSLPSELRDSFEQYIESNIDIEQASRGFDDDVTIVEVSGTYYVFKDEA